MVDQAADKAFAPVALAGAVVSGEEVPPPPMPPAMDESMPPSFPPSNPSVTGLASMSVMLNAASLKRAGVGAEKAARDPSSSAPLPGMAGADILAGVTSSDDAWKGTCIRTGKKEGRSSRNYVSHTYTDFSDTADSDVLKKYEEPVNNGGVAIPFPQKLHLLLSSPGLFDPEVIDWAPHGRCIHIKRVKEFERTSMQTHFKHRVFKHTQYTSFQRQLNLYGFKRITQGKDKGAYYHGAFVQCWSVCLTLVHQHRRRI